jgi:hypothetical protein
VIQVIHGEIWSENFTELDQLIKVTVVYEKKGDCVLVDRMDEVYAQRKKNREERKRRET